MKTPIQDKLVLTIPAPVAPLFGATCLLLNLTPEELARRALLKFLASEEIFEAQVAASNAALAEV